jgi:hypothetical protein
MVIANGVDKLKIISCVIWPKNLRLHICKDEHLSKASQIASKQRKSIIGRNVNLLFIFLDLKAMHCSLELNQSNTLSFAKPAYRSSKTKSIVNIASKLTRIAKIAESGYLNFWL